MKNIITCLTFLFIGFIVKAQITELPNGNVGIGTTTPVTKLDVRGNVTLESNTSPHLYTGTGSVELNRFLLLLNSSQRRSASGLIAGGILVSDTYAFANPSKNDLIVKGKTGLGTATPVTKLDIRGNLTLETNTSPHIYTGIGSDELNRFLLLLNSSERRSASGLKTGGLLVSDTYAYANPSKNDLIVKGKTGIGTPTPITKLDVRGNLTLETNNNPHIYTGTGAGELNRFLLLLNSSERRSASGLKTGGLLVSDTYAFANPSKNDLIVKGKAGIGTANTGSHRLAVEGSIGARQVIVESGTWSDFVFYDDYQLPSLEEVEKHIKNKGHLKDIPSESDVKKNGISLGAMDAKLLQKIEELTLYIIQQDKRIQKLENQLKEK